MKVLLDCSRISTGGGTQVSLAILHNAVHTLEYEWHVVMSTELSSEFPSELDRYFKSVLRLDRWTPFQRRIASPVFMPKYERSIRPDLVFSVFGPVYWRPKTKHLVGFAIPHLIYPETDVYQDYNLFRRMMINGVMRMGLLSFRRADYLVVETNTVRDRLESVLGIDRHRIFVIPNTYSGVFEASVKQKSPQKSAELFSIFVPAADYPHKNLGLIPHVCRDLELQGHKNFEFVFTLQEESPIWRAVQAMGQKLNLQNRMRTVGHIPHANLATYYRQADAVFLPTLLECSTAVYPESFVAGVPVATSKLDFAMELCGDAAIYFDPYSSKDAATALAGLMANPNLMDRLIENGRKQLRTSYVSHEQKWRLQLDCMETVANGTAGPGSHGQCQCPRHLRR
jgi:glycosyltransferase involved in cell wall biosynthesis